VEDVQENAKEQQTEHTTPPPPLVGAEDPCEDQRENLQGEGSRGQEGGSDGAGSGDQGGKGDEEVELEINENGGGDEELELELSEGVSDEELELELSEGESDEELELELSGGESDEELEFELNKNRADEQHCGVQGSAEKKAGEGKKGAISAKEGGGGEWEVFGEWSEPDEDSEDEKNNVKEDKEDKEIEKEAKAEEYEKETDAVPLPSPFDYGVTKSKVGYIPQHRLSKRSGLLSIEDTPKLDEDSPAGTGVKQLSPMEAGGWEDDRPPEWLGSFTSESEGGFTSDEEEAKDEGVQGTRGSTGMPEW
jgi:hypothetical protein